MAFNKQPLENIEPKSEKSGGAFSPKPQQSGSLSPKGQNMPKSNSGLSSKPKQQIYKDSTGTNWKQNPKQKDGIFKTKSFSPTNAPFVSSEKPAGPGATPEQGWKQKSNLELKQKSNPLVNNNRQKIINQGFAPATKPAQKYKWSKGLSDADNTTLNNALNKVAAWGGEKDLSKVNKQWGQDLGYQLRNDGLDEENANRLSEHFLNNAPEYSEVFPDTGESPDVPHDEDWERSWGPEETEEDRLEREEASKLFGVDLNKPAFKTGGFTKADLVRSGEDLSDYELQDDFTDMNDNPLYRLTEEGLNNKKIYDEIMKNVDKSKDAFSQRLQINNALEEYRQRNGANSVPKKVEERLMR